MPTYVNKPCYLHYEAATSQVKKRWRITKDHSKNVHAQAKFVKPVHIFLAVYYDLVLTGKLERDLQPVLFDRTFWHYVNNKRRKTHKLIRASVKYMYHLNISGYRIEIRQLLNLIIDGSDLKI